MSEPRKNYPIGRATRDAYGDALVALGAKNPDLIVLDADLSGSTRSSKFAEAYPDRFINVGIAEANMVGIGSGLVATGKAVFVSSFASFLTYKAYDQIRMAVAYSEIPLKLCGSHGGITLGEDGVSQMAAEDVALMTSLPGFTVIVPADDASAFQLVMQMASLPGPAYIRTGRDKAAIIYDKEEFRIGKGHVAADGDDVAIIANGIMVVEALVAAARLSDEGVSAAVIDMHTVKPLDERLIEEYAKKCGAIVTAEEHQIWGGLGSAVASAVGRLAPVPMEMVAIMDTYAESGTPPELKEKYGLTSETVYMATKRVVKRK